jgi:hypothetical protein
VAGNDPFPGPAAAPTLGSVLDDLLPLGLTVVATPRGTSVSVGGPALLDPYDATAVQPDDLVLAVGVDPAARETSRLVARLASAGATGLVVKADGHPPTALAEVAREGGIALLTAPVAVDWGQLYSLVRTAVAVASLPRREGDRVPVGDLFALADAVAGMVGGATTIEDPSSRVLAYSSLEHPIDPPRRDAILGRHVPQAWMQRLNEEGVFRRLWQGSGVVPVGTFGEPEMRRRLAIAVRAGGEVLGSIWVVEGDHPFGPDAEAALAEAGRLAAIHLLRHRSSADLDRRQRSDALRALLEGRLPGEQVAGLLRVDPGTPVTVVALSQPEPDEAEAAGRAQRAADLIALYCESYRRRAACVPIGGTVYVLLPDSGQSGERRTRLTPLVQSLVQRVRDSLRVDMRGGVGSTVAGLAEAAVSRREADQVLRALASEPPDHQVADIRELRSRVLLQELADLGDRMPQLRAGRLTPLVEHDRERGTAYLPTLRAYLDAFGDVGVAAGRVNVHPNTFRYRLRRLCDLFYLDLDDPDERLVLQLQIRLLDLTTPA